MAAMGPPLFPSLKQRSANRILMGSLATLNIVDDARFAPNGFVRGFIVGIKRSCSTFCVILGAGGWAAAGFTAYLSIRGDEEASIKATMRRIESNVDSDDIDNSGQDRSTPAPPPPPRKRRNNAPTLDKYAFDANGKSPGSSRQHATTHLRSITGQCDISVPDG